MRISTRTRYGLRALACLARRYGQAAVSVREIASEQRLPTKYLEQLCGTLKSAGLVMSQRGAGGGYLLARAPEDITLLEVYTVLEGAVAPVECVQADEVCPERDGCPTRALWKRLSAAVEEVLLSGTVADLVCEHKEE